MAWVRAKLVAVVCVAVLLPIGIGSVVLLRQAMAQGPTLNAASGPVGQPGAAKAPEPQPGTVLPNVFINSRSSWPWQVRLSPDGKTILYRRPSEKQAPAEGGNGANVTYELVMREIASGKDNVLPTVPVPQGYDSVLTRFNIFDGSGRKLALSRFAQDGMEIVLYDLDTGEVTPTDIRGRQVMAKFDRAGKGLVVTQGRSIALASLADFKLKALAAPGYLQSLCPTADVAAVFAVRPPGGPTSRPTDRLVLYDLAADKAIRDLPVHERNSQLDDLETQWTVDGRYLYYVDLRDDPAAAGKPVPVARVWDRVGDKEAGMIDRAIPVGPGPTPTSVILRRESGDAMDIVLHDAGTGRVTTLVPAPATLEHAWGKRIVYRTKSAEGKEELRVLDVGAPDAGAEAQGH